MIPLGCSCGKKPSSPPFLTRLGDLNTAIEHRLQRWFEAVNAAETARANVVLGTGMYLRPLVPEKQGRKSQKTVGFATHLLGEHSSKGDGIEEKLSWARSAHQPVEPFQQGSLSF